MPDKLFMPTHPSSPFSHAYIHTHHQPDSSPPGLAQWACYIKASAYGQRSRLDHCPNDTYIHGWIWRCGPTSNTWFHGPIWVLNPNSFSTGSATSAELTTVTDQQTTLLGLSPQQTASMYILRSTVMWPKNTFTTKQKTKARLSRLVHHPSSLLLQTMAAWDSQTSFVE